jgi:hypothetical protein
MMNLSLAITSSEHATGSRTFLVDRWTVRFQSVRVEKCGHGMMRGEYMESELTPRCRILFKKLIVTQLVKIFLAFFMELEGSLSYSQKPTTGPYPDAAESSSPHRSLSP